MTREEAIKRLKLTDACDVDLCEALDMAIKALEQQSTDAVDRQAVLDALDKSKYSNEFCEEHHIDWSINLGMAHIVVNELKPVTPQPKMGCWIYHDGYIPYKHECSECGKRFGTDFNYCPYCGCAMKGELE